MSEESFLREIEEELQRDKLKSFWNRYGIYLIGVLVLIIALVAGNEAYKWYRTSTAAASSQAYYDALEKIEAGDLVTARSELEALEASGPKGYATVAKFRLASLKAEQGDIEAAIADYDALGASIDEPRMRDLAQIFAAYLAVDVLDAGAVEARVGAMVGADHPFRNAAREALGLSYYKAADYDKARANFEAMASDMSASRDVQMRSYLYLEQVESASAAIAASSNPEAATETPATEL